MFGAGQGVIILAPSTPPHQYVATPGNVPFALSCRSRPPAHRAASCVEHAERGATENDLLEPLEHMAFTTEQKLAAEQAIADAKVQAANLELQRAQIDAAREQARLDREQGVEGEAQRRRQEAAAAEQAAAVEADREEADKANIVPLGLDAATDRVLGRFDGEYDALDGSVCVLRLRRDHVVLELQDQARKFKSSQSNAHQQFVYKNVATARAYLNLTCHTAAGLVDETDDLATEVSRLAAELRDPAAPEGAAAEGAAAADAGGADAVNEDEADREQRAAAIENVADRIVQLGDYLRRVRNTLSDLDEHVVHRLEHFLTLKAFPPTTDSAENIRLLLHSTTIPEGEPADLEKAREARELAYIKKANYKIAEDEFSRRK